MKVGAVCLGPVAKKATGADAIIVCVSHEYSISNLQGFLPYFVGVTGFALYSTIVVL